jgi:hypothetical protein
MRKASMIVVATFLVLSLAIPALADKSAGVRNAFYRVSNDVYTEGTSRLSETEYHVTEILRNTFGLFNPCLDLVKGCTSLVLRPLELPFDLVNQAKAKPRIVKKRAPSKIPVPEKPEMPKK